MSLHLVRKGYSLMSRGRGFDSKPVRNFLYQKLAVIFLERFCSPKLDHTQESLPIWSFLCFSSRYSNL